MELDEEELKATRELKAINNIIANGIKNKYRYYKNSR